MPWVQIPYVPATDDYVSLFRFCGIETQTEDFGGNQGWSLSNFDIYRQQASDYLFDHDDGTFDNWYKMLDDFPVNYWSTEIIV